jgi:hypothetical protein
LTRNGIRRRCFLCSPGEDEPSPKELVQHEPLPPLQEEVRTKFKESFHAPLPICSDPTHSIPSTKAEVSARLFKTRIEKVQEAANVAKAAVDMALAAAATFNKTDNQIEEKYQELAALSKQKPQTIFCRNCAAILRRLHTIYETSDKNSGNMTSLMRDEIYLLDAELKRCDCEKEWTKGRRQC